MKRFGSLFEEVTDRENLRLAWYSASRGKRYNVAVLAYRRDLERNLRRLRETLLDPKHEGIGHYRFFTIYEPKERRICAASFPDRVLQHAMMNVLEPHFESFQIYDSFACRKRKGSDAALKRALFNTRRYRYFAKLDVRRYFDSIDHETLKRLLKRRFKDRDVLGVIYSVIDSYHTEPEKGIPIGNLTSQYFANHYLAYLDHYAKKQLHVPAWIRYMDDILFFGNDRDGIRETVKAAITFCGRNLLLSLKSSVFGPVSTGISFLGFHVKPKGIYLTQKKRRRSARRLVEYARRFQLGAWTDSELVDHLLPVCAHLSIARSRSIRNNLIEWTGLRQ